MTVTQRTMKRLSIVSRNQCAFSGCINSLIDESTGTVTGEICHITAKNPKGPRYDRSLTNEQRDEYTNLLMMCPSHHKVVDTNPTLYPAEMLTEMKSKLESGGDSTNKLPEGIVKVLIEHFTRSPTTVSSHNQKGGQTANIIVNQGNPAVQDKRVHKNEKLFNDFFNPIYSDISTVLETFCSGGYDLGYSKIKYDELRQTMAFHLKKYGNKELLGKVDDFYKISEKRQKHREIYPEKANKIINQCVESIGRTKRGKWNVEKNRNVCIDVKFNVLNNEGEIKEKDVNLSYDVLFSNIGISLLRGGVNREITDFSRVLLHRTGGAALDISYCWDEIYACINRKAKIDPTLKYLRDSVDRINDLGNSILSDIEEEFS